MLVVTMVVMSSGVPGLLTKNTLSPPSLSSSSAPAEIDRASTSVGLCLPSGTIVRKPSAFDNGRSFPTLAVKKCVYSGSLTVLALTGSWTDASSAVISSSGLWYWSVADRW